MSTKFQNIIIFVICILCCIIYTISITQQINVSNEQPAWSVGLTYGYLLGFGRNDRWGLEFLAGAGYGTYTQKVGQWNEIDKEWQRTDVHTKRYFGLTRFAINLTYRFDIPKLRIYYDE